MLKAFSHNALHCHNVYHLESLPVYKKNDPNCLFPVLDQGHFHQYRSADDGGEL